MKASAFSSLLLFLIFASCNEDKHAKTELRNESAVQFAGAMRNVMQKGELSGTILLDTISNRTNLYGVGPLEYLRGEILVSGGITFGSRVGADNLMAVKAEENVEAPFFVYATVKKWREVSLPESVSTIKQLETFLDETTKNSVRPFAFRVAGVVERAVIHVVNLPEGTIVRSPADAHQGEMKYTIENAEAELVGFFSTDHAGVFTHHDTFVHIHLMTNNKQQMGHLDELHLARGAAKLFLPDTDS